MDIIKQDLLNLDLDNIEFENSKEIEFEVSEWTSLIYEIDNETYYAYTLDLYDEEEYKAPINIDDDTDLLFSISVEDKHNFKKLISELKEKGEI